MRNDRGAVLGITIMTALICGIAAYAVLFTSVSEARHTKFMKGRVGARYLSEAAIVYARERLWQNPAFCLTNQPVTIDTNGSGVLGDAVGVPPEPDKVVDFVTISNCGAGNQHVITARVDY